MSSANEARMNRSSSAPMESAGIVVISESMSARAAVISPSAPNWRARLNASALGSETFCAFARATDTMTTNAERIQRQGIGLTLHAAAETLSAAQIARTTVDR